MSPLVDYQGSDVQDLMGVLPGLSFSATHAGNFVPGQIGATYIDRRSNGGLWPTAGPVSVTDTLPGARQGNVSLGRRVELRALDDDMHASDALRGGRLSADRDDGQRGRGSSRLRRSTA